MREAKEAFFNTSRILEVDRKLVGDLIQKARVSPTRRFRLCLHRSTEEAIQEMFIVHGCQSYSRPHCHPRSEVSLTVIEGELQIVLFDDEGNVTRSVELGSYQSDKPFCLRLECNCWYMPLCRSDYVVLHETTRGPFRDGETNLPAAWSPREDDAEGVAEFLARIGGQ